MISAYIIIGLIWTGWLEYYTTNFLEGIVGSPWKMKERLFHIFLWPFSLFVFLNNIR